LIDRIVLVFASWSFERLSDCDGPLLAAVCLVPSLCLPNILVFHHQYIQASLCIWLLLASCFGVLLRFRALLAPCFWHRSGSVLRLLRWLGSPLDATWGRYAVVGRLILSNGCVSGLKEVGFVRSGLVQSMFDAIDV